MFDEEIRPETSVTFILRGTGIVLVLFYIYSIVPYASAFFAQFLSFYQCYVITSLFVLQVDDVMMYPSDQPHEQSFAYFVINPIKRHVIVWYHSWRG